MDGHDRSAGAVAGIAHIRNPILLAEKVLTDSPHVMLIGAGAEEFAQGQGFELVDNAYFQTERRRKQLKRLQAQGGQISLSEDTSDDFEPDKQLGTVGAVAIDRKGNIAAGTSTGGMTNKRFGRIGDSPIIGAGTYADENCGISATGHGEYFIRAAVAHDICARVRYQGVSLSEAANTVVNEVLVNMGADGGVIAIDKDAEITTPFNSVGMYRAMIDRNGVLSVGIFR
jgi:beta-aspartyl-peptidase (threonine type)